MELRGRPAGRRKFVFYSPEGTRYETDALMAWAREHEKMLWRYTSKMAYKESLVFCFYTNMINVGYWRRWHLEGVMPPVYVKRKYNPSKLRRYEFTAPDGATVHTDNLLGWARENIAMLRSCLRGAKNAARDDEKIARYFRSMLVSYGKWHGWKLINYVVTGKK